MGKIKMTIGDVYFKSLIREVVREEVRAQVRAELATIRQQERDLKGYEVNELNKANLEQLFAPEINALLRGSGDKKIQPVGKRPKKKPVR